MLKASNQSLRPLWPDFEYKPHQLFGVRWMLEREGAEDGPRGGILADEMGLGKTIQMAGLIKNGVRKLGEQVLLVTPVAVLEQWRAVMLRCGFAVLVPGRKGYSWEADPASGPQKSLVPQIHMLGYERLTRNSGLGKLYRWDRIIFDEAHRLNGERVGQLAKELRADRKWLLTATPIVNGMEDLANLLEVIGLRDVPKSGGAATHAAYAKQYILARTMQQLRDTIPDAPPVPRFETVKLDFATEEEAEFYRGMTGMITRRWRAIAADGGAGAAMERLRLFMRLRQLSLHPQVYIAARKKALGELYTRPDWAGSSTKFDALRRLIQGSEEGHKWIIFCHFREEMEMLRTMLLGTDGVERVQIYNGGLGAAEKEGVLRATQAPLGAGKHEVLLVQLQSGGVGLNLQHFDRILFTGPWWTSALMEQAVGRAVRIGQHKQVVVTHLNLKEEEAMNIDNYMREKAAAKGALCAAVLAVATTRVS